MRAAVPVGRLREVWESGPGRAGDPRGVSRVRATQIGGLDQVIVTTEFERSAWDVQITFRPDGRVAGLFVRPGVAAAAAPTDVTGPAAVHGAAIVATFVLVALFWYALRRRFAIPGRLYFFGAVIFIASQVAHVPFNAIVLPSVTRGGGDLVTTAVALGLSAAAFEELARYLAFRFWLRTDRGWTSALGLGAGHGGIEAILLAAIAGISLIAAILGRVMPSAPAALVDTSALYWSRPAALALALPVERAFALALHLSLAALVMRSVDLGDIRYLAAAVAWHALVDASAYYLLITSGVVATEAAVAVFAAISLAVVWGLRPAPQPALPAAPSPIEPGTTF